MFPFNLFHFGWSIHDISSPKMKFHFCQVNRSVITAANEFHFGLHDVNRSLQDKNKNVSFHLIKSHVSVF